MSFLTALIAEWIVNGLISGRRFTIPLAAFIFFMWAWRRSLIARLWVGLVLGFFLDTLYLVPFGTYSMLFFVLSLLCELARTIFSNTESLLTQSIGVIFLVGIFLAGAPVSALFISLITFR